MKRSIATSCVMALGAAVAVSLGSPAIGATMSFQEDVTNGGSYQAGAAYIDNNSPDTVFDNASAFVGAITPSTRITRVLLSFDLSSLPAGATVDSVTLNMKARSEDGSSTSEDHSITLHELTTPFVESEATWNSASTGNAWTAAGGDFDATVLSSVVANPTTLAEGDTLAFASSPDLVSLAQSVADSDGTIYLLLDSDSNNDDDRGLFRLWADDLNPDTNPDPSVAHPELVVEFTQIPEPASIVLALFGACALGFVGARKAV